MLFQDLLFLRDLAQSDKNSQQVVKPNICIVAFKEIWMSLLINVDPDQIEE